jgi:hypothetical protein
VELKKKDDDKMATEEAKNSLEAYTISTREKVGEDGEVAAVSTEAEREALVEELMAAEDWIYGDGESAGVHEFRAKLLGLKNKADPIFERAKEAVERPAAVAAAKKFIESAKSTVGTDPQTKCKTHVPLNSHWPSGFQSFSVAPRARPPHFLTAVPCVNTRWARGRRRSRGSTPRSRRTC